jgi:hypothetical protein
MTGDQENPAEAAHRLEEALERIARVARDVATRIPPRPIEPDHRAEVAARLDTLIARLRSALGPQSA